MNSAEFQDLKEDILVVKNQLVQMMDFIENVYPEMKPEKQKFEILEDDDDDEYQLESLDSSYPRIEKYVLRRKLKLKKKRTYRPDEKDIEASHTIITKDVLRDLETKGYSDVHRHVNEEDIPPINDPIHVQIYYTFGFALASDYNKYNAIILIGNFITYNVIHINLAKKLHLRIFENDSPFTVNSSSGNFESYEFVELTVGINLGNKNRMFKDLFVVSRQNHHDDMIVVCGRCIDKLELNLYDIEKFYFDELEENMHYIL